MGDGIVGAQSVSWPADPFGEFSLVGTELLVNQWPPGNTSPSLVRVVITSYDPNTKTATIQALGYIAERTNVASNGYKTTSADLFRDLTRNLDYLEEVCRVYTRPPWYGVSYQRAVPCLGAACKPPVSRGLSRRRFGRRGMSLAQRSRHKRRMWVQHLREVS